MDEDLSTVVSLPEELDEEIGSIDVDEELASLEQKSKQTYITSIMTNFISL